MFEKIQKLAALFRDVGLILGVPAVLYVAIQLHGLQQEGMQAQIASLKEQIEALRERQYDRAATIIKAQKEVSEAELDAIERSINLVGGQKIKIRDFKGKLLCLNLKQGG